jgi:hypothetical protein
LEIAQSRAKWSAPVEQELRSPLTLAVPVRPTEELSLILALASWWIEELSQRPVLTARQGSIEEPEQQPGSTRVQYGIRS